MSEVSKREEETLRFWQERKIFEKSLEKPTPNGEYVFYDGPPFATGLPHYGHIVASVIKDVVPRFWTMRGYHVPRVWGWDCHGLPIENIVEKELGFKHKKEIVAMGVAKFNERCRARVLEYASEWEKIIPRIGRWADMKGAFRTMDKPFMESVWWVFKELWDKGLVYEDYRSMHICPRCETTLSQQEVSEGYKDVKDIAVTVKFELVDEPGIHLLAWTTTPWTLPGNVALAVGKDIEYVKVTVSEKGSGGVLRNDNSYQLEELKEETVIIAKERLSILESTFDIEIISSMKGSELVGKSYKPPFDYYINDKNLKNRENGWKVYAADFVTAEDGTGIAHEAPAFGADDWELLKKVNLPFVQHVNSDGSVKQEVKELAGKQAKPIEDPTATDVEVIKYLAHKGLLFAKEKIEHAYPHCWRCDTPLLNYATSSWFVSVTKIKDNLLKNAKPINWSPKHIKEGRWGKWLEGARDWSISRQRFWASVMPVWVCEKCKTKKVFGSVADLEKASGRKIDDLHKHIVDDIVFTCWECDGEMHRVPDVLDTWFDSGSMPYGQVHYPFENKQKFDATFPAQFIAEGLDQTRAWFYYLHVLAGALFKKNAFQNVIVNGIVLAEDGKKMSKKLQNYPDPMEIVQKYGADALRYYLLSSPVMQAENLNFSEKGVDEAAKKLIGRLGNVLAFYQLYEDGTERDWKSTHILDRWILARLDQLIAKVTEEFEAYRLDTATRPIGDFIDDLSTWYLRRSRERFKEEAEDPSTSLRTGKKAALATLRYTLHALSLVMAPSMPFLAEHVFQAVREGEDEESVHLAQWPEGRATANFLQRFFGGGGGDARLLTAMSLARAVASQALEARDTAKIKVRQPLESYSTPEASKLPKEYLVLIAEEINVKEVKPGPESLDTNITDKLSEEGFVRDTIREIQAFRKSKNLKPGEHATYRTKISPDYSDIILKHKDQIQQTTHTTIELTMNTPRKASEPD